MKRLIFITEMHQIPKLISLAEKDDTIVALRREVSDALQSKNIKFKCLDDYPQPSEADALAWMKKWPRKKLNEKTFIQSLVHNKLSIWWLMESWLYYSSVYFDSLRDILMSLKTIEAILDKELPNEIIFADDGKINSEILKLFTEYDKKIIPMRLFRAAYNTKRLARVFLIGRFIDFGFGARKFIWSLIKPFQKDSKGDALFISTYAWGLARNSAGKYTKYDPFIDPVISRLKSSVITVNIPVGRLLGLGQMFVNARNPTYRPVENYYDWGVRKSYRAAVRSILIAWNSIRRNGNFIASFEYNGRNIWPLVERQFSAYFSARLKGHLRDAELIKAMLEKERPKIVVYPAEMSEFGRTLFHLCSLYGITSVAMQHGTFPNKYLSCMHTKGESRVGVASPRNCPIPTKTFVYGPKYKRSLLEGNYPKNSVIATGSQRFDRIILERGRFNKILFCKSLGIDSGRKIVAFVTSPVPAGDTEAMTTAVIDAVKELDMRLVIKLHPSENFSIYRNIVSMKKSDAVIVRDIDLYEVLDACDIMITHLSTAAIESMIFGKPVIILNLTGKPDRVDYVKRGAALGVYRKDDLLPVMKELLDNKRPLTKMQKRIRAFIFDTAYLTDGKASMRAADAIERLTQK